ncbi:7739_t:CDS:2 [Paraglomus occultum]|uniref:7739_t:CDS:1 n=1 Tax=Paraglomus occultum TaxID=144539 RepID=A0A9N9C646_9GLOM|nr:7739_t:CDS:2 [Paraglomus occultum]
MSKLDIQLVEPVISFRGGPREAIGCFLRGDLIIHLQKPTKVKCIELKFMGREKIGFSEGTCPIRNAGAIREERELISNTWTFLDPIPTKLTASATRFHLLRKSNPKSMQSRLLPAGKHTYPFEIFLPGNLPETIKTDHVHVEYTLEGKLMTNGVFPCRKIKKHIEVVRTIPDHLNSQGVATAREITDTFAYEISLPKLAYPIGQTAPLDIKISPLSKHFVLHGIKVEIHEKCVYHIRGRDVTSNNIVLSEALPIFDKTILSEDGTDGFFYGRTLPLKLPKFSSLVHPSCDTSTLTITHQMKIVFIVSAPILATHKMQIKVNMNVKMLSCKCMDDHDVALPNYDEDSCYCPLDPVYQRMAHLVLGDVDVDLDDAPPDYEKAIAEERIPSEETRA